jgi:hypothetical protein
VLTIAQAVPCGQGASSASTTRDTLARKGAHTKEAVTLRLNAG